MENLLAPRLLAGFPRRSLPSSQEAWNRLCRASHGGDAMVESRVDVYLCAPEFVGIKVRGTGGVGQGDGDSNVTAGDGSPTMECANFDWEVKLRHQHVGSSSLPGLEQWKKWLVKWGDIPKIIERNNYSKNEQENLKQAMEANIQITVQKRRINFSCDDNIDNGLDHHERRLYQELIELQITDITIQGKSVMASGIIPVPQTWYSACIESSKRHYYSQDEMSTINAIEKCANKIIKGVSHDCGDTSKAAPFVIHGGYPSWISALKTQLINQEALTGNMIGI